MTIEELCNQKMKSKSVILKRLEMINNRYFQTESSESYDAQSQEQDAGQIIALSWVLGIKLKGDKS